MNIELNGGYRITNDEYQYILQKNTGIRKSGERAGEINWRSEAFFTDLGLLAKYLVQRRIFDSKAESMAELAKDAESAVTAVCSDLAPRFNVQVRE